MGVNRDYQNKMSTDTASVDSIAEEEAANVTVETDGVHQELVDGPPIEGYKPYKTMRGIFGMLPSQEVRTDYARTREGQFRQLAEYTGGSSNPLGNGRGTETAAYRSQQRMMLNYGADVALIPEAQRDFSMLVPLANMAARSYAKTNSIGLQTDLNDVHGPELDTKDDHALAAASNATANGLALREQDSLAIASHEMMSARLTVVSASQGMAKVVADQAIAALSAELKDSTDKQAAIEAKIAKVTQIVGYLETAGTKLSGAGEFVNNNIPGAPQPTEKETKEEQDKSQRDLRSGTYSGAESAGDAIATGGGYLTTAVSFGVQLYYADELNRIKLKIDQVQLQLDGEHQRSAKAAVAQAYTNFANAAAIYKLAVEKYEAKINDRRAAMAAIGAKADKLLDAGKPKKERGLDTDTSDAMLWTATVMETQSFLATAMEAGVAAKTTMDRVTGEVYQHRTAAWGTREDAYTGNNLPRSEGLDGPDISVLRQMRDLTSWWMEGATDLKQAIDGVAEGQGAETLKKVGYTGDY